MNPTRPNRRIALGLVAILAALLVFDSVAQDRPGRDFDDDDAAEQGEGDDSRPRPSRRGFDFKDDDTSENNPTLKRALERFPEADKNKDGVLTANEARVFWAEQREKWRDRRRRGGVEPTHHDIAYGPDANQAIDLYLAESDKPTPLVVYFHGGQFITGDEDQLGTLDVGALLASGISVAAIDYRDTNDGPFPMPFEDGARALQFLRYYAEQINIDPEKIAGHGEEAGGNIALFLSMHDDLAIDADEITLPPQFLSENDDRTAAAKQPPAKLMLLPDEDSPEAQLDPDKVPEVLAEPWEDPRIAAESTRLSCVVARHPIASFDPRDWKKHKLPMNDHERLMKKYLAVRYLEPLDDEEVIALVEQVSPLHLASRDDGEVLLMSQYKDLDLEDDLVWTIMRHHPKQSLLIAEALKSKGVRATVRYLGMPNDPGTTSIDFFIRKLK